MQDGKQLCPFDRCSAKVKQNNFKISLMPLQLQFYRGKKEFWVTRHPAFLLIIAIKYPINGYQEQATEKVGVY